MYLEIILMHQRSKRLLADVHALKHQAPAEIARHTKDLFGGVGELLHDALGFCRTLNEEIDQLKEERRMLNIALDQALVHETTYHAMLKGMLSHAEYQRLLVRVHEQTEARLAPYVTSSDA